MAIKRLEGQKFNKWTVLAMTDERDGDGCVIWQCQCECGTIKNISGKTLRKGVATSCGCVRKEKMTTHGQSKERLYDIWHHIKDRTGNPESWSAENYHDRGIRLCEEWLDFEVFSNWANQNGYTEQTTIDRIDVNGNYEPDNCRWTTPLQQANNRRTCVMLEFNGKTQSMADWARELGMSYETVRSRHRRGWSIERMLSTPQQIKNKKEN